MATLNVVGTYTGNALELMMTGEDIRPGLEPSYQLCKTLYEYHPLGAKMTEKPVRLAMSQKREINVPAGPKERLTEAFEREWKKVGANRHIFNVKNLSRIYGVAAIALMVEEIAPDQPVDYWKLYQQSVSFNILDPLNIAGSVVLNQDPNASDFQKVRGISVQGKTYHPSRAVAVMNGDPIYIAYVSSGFGYTGRSVYQRVLYPMKSFLQSMVTDDMVTRKAGVLVAMMKMAGSIIDNLMAKVAGFKRALLKEAESDNVISIGETEKIESLNLQGLEAPLDAARRHVLENIAAGDDMPAKLLNEETFAEGFGEGTEDAKAVAHYVDRIREEMEIIYAWFDKIVQHRAWNADFFKAIQNDFPEAYGSADYKATFYEWQNSFTATWPNYITEPDSEKLKGDDVKLRAVIAMLEILMPALDPDNKATLIEWASDNFNEFKRLFDSPLILDFEAIADFETEKADQAKEQFERDGAEAEGHAEGFGMKAADAVEQLKAAVARLPELPESVPHASRLAGMDQLRRRMRRDRANA